MNDITNNATIVLFWRDTNWEHKGAADNIWLTIDTTMRVYKKVVSSWCNTNRLNVVEIKHKSEIDCMIDYLKNLDYTER